MTATRSLYANEKQITFLSALHKVRVLMASRGLGKTVCIGYSSMVKLQNLPGSKGLLTCKTLKQLKGKSMAEIEAVWKLAGMKRDYHYKLYNKKPDHFPTLEHIKEPESDDVIWFADGSCIEIVAAVQYDAARGGSYDYCEADEIGHFPEEFFDEVLIPSIRGNTGRYVISAEMFCQLNGITLEHLNSHNIRNSNEEIQPHYMIKNPFHHQISMYGSPPKLARAGKRTGTWVYRFEVKAKTDPDFFWLSGNVYDNKHAFGEDNIAVAKKVMTDKAFKLEFGIEKMDEAEFKFYYAFSQKNIFTPEKIYKSNAEGILEAIPKSIDPLRLINLSFDFSGWFNCMLIIQPEGDNEIIHDAMHIKQEGGIDLLVDNFCEKYKDNPTKFVLLYGEPRGHNKTPFGITIYDAIEKRFKKNGWESEIRCPKNHATENHIDRYEKINEILADTNPLFPKVKISEACKDFITAVKNCEVNPDFTKNKKVESDRDYKQEHAPHYTDCLDYYLYQRHGDQIK